MLWEWGLQLRESGPLKTVVTLFILNCTGTYTTSRGPFLFENKKGWVLHSNRGPCECVILNLKGKNQETLILIFKHFIWIKIQLKWSKWWTCEKNKLWTWISVWKISFHACESLKFIWVWKIKRKNILKML